jgi:hypothetical protein
MIDDQHTEHAEHRNRNRHLQRPATSSTQTIVRQNLRHLKIRL